MTLSQWYKNNIELKATDRYLIVEHIKSLPYKPKISIITPVYNTRPIWLEECIKSVFDQLYDNWELCICDNGSTTQGTKDVLKSINDPRVKIIQLDSNAGISGGSNAALELATGDYICLLDSDDKLLEQSLYLVAESINRNANVKYIYTDELILDSGGNAIQSFFKPDWSPDLLRSQCYTNHLSIYKGNLLKSLKFRDGFDGSQDYDLVLRVTENLSKNEIEHISTVGYLWRTHSGSSSANNESTAINSAINALKEHLERKDKKAQVIIDWPWYRVKYELPNPPPPVGILICSINKNNLLIKCIADLLGHTDYPNYKFYLCVPDAVKAVIINKFNYQVKQDKISFITQTEGFNYSLFANRLIDVCKEDVVCLINDDIEPLTDSWLSEMVSLAVQSHIGVVGAKLVYPNMTIQHAGAVLGIGGNCAHVFKQQHYTYMGYHGRAKLINNFTVVTGACAVIRKSVYKEVGGYPEEQAIAFNDVDFCIKLVKAGYYNIYTPHALMIHYESATRGYDTTPAQKAVFIKEDAWLKNKWKDFLLKDPFYNPNLALESITFDVTENPRYKKPWLS